MMIRSTADKRTSLDATTIAIAGIICFLPHGSMHVFGLFSSSACCAGVLTQAGNVLDSRPFEREIERGAFWLPWVVHYLRRLERDLRDETERSCVASEHCLRIVEVGIAGYHEALVSPAHRIETVDIIHSEAQSRVGSWNELRMVEQIAELCPEAELDSFGDVDVLVQSQVNMIGGSSRKRVPAYVRKRARTRDNEAGIRVRGQIGDCIAPSVREVGNIAGIPS